MAPSPRRGRSTAATVLWAVAVIAIAITVRAYIAQPFFIPSGSMEPELAAGDRVLVNKLAYEVGDINRGDVVVFRHTSDGTLRQPWWSDLAEAVTGATANDTDDGYYIKRVLGLPGETVNVRSDGSVIVDGREVDEVNIPPAEHSPIYNGVVPDGEFFVLGDARANSLDSRSDLGFVPEHAVVGKASWRVWPMSRAGELQW